MSGILLCLVVAIQDGDTLTCLAEDKQQIKVRLAEIDAPEKRQDYGARSKQSLAELCYQQHATLHTESTDRYGRSVAHVECQGVDANTEQVRRGMAWVYDKYVKDKSLYEIQQDAQQARRGLWADKSPTAPWDFRRKKKVD